MEDIEEAICCIASSEDLTYAQCHLLGHARQLPTTDPGQEMLLRSVLIHATTRVSMKTMGLVTICRGYNLKAWTEPIRA